MSAILQQSSTYVIFQVSDDSYGIGVDYLKEVIQTDKILKLPRTSEALTGIINLRGYILSVFDLFGLLWKSGRTSPNNDSQDNAHKQYTILVSSIQDKDLGILVDHVHQLTEVNEFREVKRSDFHGRDLVNPSFITQVGILDKTKKIFIIDMENVLGNYFTIVRSPEGTASTKEDFDFDLNQFTLPDEEPVADLSDQIISGILVENEKGEKNREGHSNAKKTTRNESKTTDSDKKIVKGEEKKKKSRKKE
ncbi:MAG: chemotaxis protein CheW [Candidatus Thorarchaeota archaeon]